MKLIGGLKHILAMFSLFGCEGNQNRDPGIAAVADIFQAEGIVGTLVVATADSRRFFCCSILQGLMRSDY